MMIASHSVCPFDLLVAVDAGQEALVGILLGDRAGHDVRTAVHAVKRHLKVRRGGLLTVGQNFFVNYKRRAIAELCARRAVGGIHAAICAVSMSIYPPSAISTSVVGLRIRSPVPAPSP